MVEWNAGIAKITLPTPFPVGNVNVYLIKGDRLTLIDAGVNTEESWNSFKEQIKDLHLTPDDIEQIVLTHHHPDHAGGLNFFQDSVEVYGHPLNERWIHPTEEFFRLQEASFRVYFKEFGLPKEFFPYLTKLRGTLKYSCNRSLNGTLTEGMTPIGLSEWRVLETPGHAQSQIALFREKDGVLIGGDLMLAHISPNPLLEPPAYDEQERPKPLLQHNHSMKTLLDFPIQCVYTGHGEEIYELPALIERRLTRQHDRAMMVKNWLEQEELTVFDICMRLFPSVYQKELMLTISETVGQIDYLESIGEITSDNNQPRCYKALK